MTAGAASTSMSDSNVMSPTNYDMPKRRLSRQVAADTVAIGDGVSIVIGGLLPALFYAVIGNVKIDQYLIVQSTVIAAFIAHLCLRFRGAYDTSRMDKFPQVPLELLIAICCGLAGVLGIGLCWPCATSIFSSGTLSGFQQAIR